MASRAPFVIAGHESRRERDKQWKFRLPNYTPTRLCIYPLKWFMAAGVGLY